MAVVRSELEIPEVQGILELLKGVDRKSDLWRARRELRRALDRALESQRRDRENMARTRRNRRPLPEHDEPPLTPQSMSRYRRSAG